MEIIVKIGFFIVTAICGIAILSLTSCKMVDVTYYRHSPSTKFEKYYDLNDIKSIDGDVVFTVKFRSSDSNTHKIWLSLYSKSPSESVFISEANVTIAGIDHKLEIKERFEVKDSKEESSYLRHHILLGRLDDSFLEHSINDDGKIHMRLYYEIDGNSKTMDFHIQRIVSSEAVFPT